MAVPRKDSSDAKPGRLLAIGAVVGVVALSFVYTAGWLSPNRLTPTKIVDTLAPAGGPALGYRRNHAKGICFSGTFESNGAGAALSKAQVMAAGKYPVTGRFNLAGPSPTMQDGTGRVRGLSLRIQTPDRQEWRTAMITPPFFPAATPQDFYDLQIAGAKKDDPDAMKKYAATHPALVAFGGWAKSAPFTESYTQDGFNSLNSFVFTNAQGQDQTVRWSFVPTAQAVAIPADELKTRDADFLETDITAKVAAAAQKWTLLVTVANPGDPTADPSKAWPDDRRKVDVGSLVVSKIEPEAEGPCRDLNFDPTVLPAGIRTSDDPFPAARSAAYAVSYNRRTAEEKDYPRTGGASSTGAKP
jgi:catalase